MGNAVCAQAHKDKTGDLVAVGRYFVLPGVMGCKEAGDSWYT